MWARDLKIKKGKTTEFLLLEVTRRTFPSWDLMCWVFLLSIRPLHWETGPNTSHILKSQSQGLSPLLFLAGQKNECSAPYWWNRPSQFQTQSPPLIGGTKKWMFSSLLVEQALSVPDSVPFSYWRNKKMNVQLPIGGTGPVSSRLSSLLWLAGQ